MTAMEEYISLGKQFDEGQLKAAVRILREAAERWEAEDDAFCAAMLEQALAEGDDEGWVSLDDVVAEYGL